MIFRQFNYTGFAANIEWLFPFHITTIKTTPQNTFYIQAPNISSITVEMILI